MTTTTPATTSAAGASVRTSATRSWSVAAIRIVRGVTFYPAHCPLHTSKMLRTTQSAIPTNPSDVACIDLINSTFTDYLGTGDSSDRITSQEWQEWFLHRYGLKPESRDPLPVEELVSLRSDL